MAMRHRPQARYFDSRGYLIEQTANPQPVSKSDRPDIDLEERIAFNEKIMKRVEAKEIAALIARSHDKKQVPKPAVPQKSEAVVEEADFETWLRSRPMGPMPETTEEAKKRFGLVPPTNIANLSNLLQVSEETTRKQTEKMRWKHVYTGPNGRVLEEHICGLECSHPTPSGPGVTVTSQRVDSEHGI